MVMAIFADLNKCYSVIEMVDYFLPASPMPPFNGIIVFPTGANEPKRFGRIELNAEWQMSCLLPPAQIEVSSEGVWFKRNAQICTQVPNITVDKVVRKLIRLMHQRIMAFHDACFRVVIGNPSDERIVLP